MSHAVGANTGSILDEVPWALATAELSVEYSPLQLVVGTDVVVLVVPSAVSCPLCLAIARRTRRHRVAKPFLGGRQQRCHGLCVVAQLRRGVPGGGHWCRRLVARRMKAACLNSHGCRARAGRGDHRRPPLSPRVRRLGDRPRSSLRSLVRQR